MHSSYFFNGLALSLATLASVLAGVSLVEHPPLAIVPVAVVVAGGLAASSFHKPVAVIFLLVALGISASVDIFGRVAVGPTSAYSWVTAGMIAVLLIVVSTGAAAERHSGASRAVLLVALFPAYAAISVFWYRPTLAATQNVLVYLAFALVFLLAVRATTSGDLGFTLLRKALFWTYSVGAGLYLGSLAFDGLGGGAVIGSRSYALFAVTGIAWGAALGRCGYRREAGLAAFSLLLVLLSLSRLAFAAGLLILLLAALDFRTASRVNRSVVVVTLVALIGYLAMTSFSPFTQRFSSGDIVSVGGGVSLNVEGRFDLWSLTWHSAISSPWFGSGSGSSEEVIANSIGRPNHPHNDYLRVFHDFGVVGLALFMSSLLYLLHLSWRLFTNSTSCPSRALHLAATLELVALCIAMTTDNAVVYLFFTLPVAIIVGASSASANTERVPCR